MFVGKVLDLFNVFIIILFFGSIYSLESLIVFRFYFGI